jgi:cholecystokinin A receptor/hypocretin (orexin) receptor 2
MEEKVANLLEKQHEISMHLLPVIICMVILGISGLIGNCLTVVFYIRKQKTTASVTLIVSLAVVDLAVCVLIVPCVLEMLSSLTYYQGFMCKLSHFSTRWTISSSCAIIWIISIDRYRKICKPFDKQITPAMVKRAMCATAITTFLLSVKNFFTFDSVSIDVHDFSNNRTLTGQYCTTHKDEQYRSITLAFYGIDVCLILMAFLTMAFTYSNIIYTLVKLRQKRKRTFQNLIIFEEILKNKLPKRFTRVSSDISGMTRNTTEVSLINYATGRDIDKKRLSDITDKCRTDINKDTSKPNIAIQEEDLETNQTVKISCVKKSKEHNLTVMMLVVSILYILCFSPYFAIRITLRLGTGSDEFEMNAGVQTALRLVYINSVFNPIIYFIFNPKFRRFVKNKFKC